MCFRVCENQCFQLLNQFYFQFCRLCKAFSFIEKGNLQYVAYSMYNKEIE